MYFPTQHYLYHSANQFNILQIIQHYSREITVKKAMTAQWDSLQSEHVLDCTTRKPRCMHWIDRVTNVNMLFRLALRIYASQ